MVDVKQAVNTTEAMNLQQEGSVDVWQIAAPSTTETIDMFTRINATNMTHRDNDNEDSLIYGKTQPTLSS